MTKDEQKQAAATGAIDTLIAEGKIFSGMRIGLGTGSTAMPAVRRLWQRIQDGTLRDIAAVPTSFQTQLACESYGIPVFSLSSRRIAGHLDLCIDGADEIDMQNNLIKGGGAALLREKLCAYNSSVYAIVADESKSVPDLGTRFPLPVEIIPEAHCSVVNALQDTLGAECTLREGVRKCGPVITDNGNFIVDCLWRSPVEPGVLEDRINAIAGVVECGFFTKLRPTVFIAQADGTLNVRK